MRRQASNIVFRRCWRRRRRLRIFRSRHIARRGAVSFGQLYRDRGDSENIFDELKNQWGWAASSRRTLLVPTGRAHDRVVLRLVEHLRSSGRAGPAYGGHHQPATALACHRHAGAACETNNDHRSEFTREGASGREGVSRCRHFLRGLAKNAEQLTGLQRWRRILARAFQVFLQGRQLRSPPRLAPG